MSINCLLFNVEFSSTLLIIVLLFTIAYFSVFVTRYSSDLISIIIVVDELVKGGSSCRVRSYISGVEGGAATGGLSQPSTTTIF